MLTLETHKFRKTNDRLKNMTHITDKISIVHLTKDFYYSKEKNPTEQKNGNGDEKIIPRT